MSNQKLTLAAAAEALIVIEAAGLEADAISQKEMLPNLDSLKASFDSNLVTVVQTMKASNDNLINTLNHHLTGVKNEINALRSLLEEEKKQKTLYRALDLADVNSFKYYYYHYHSHSYKDESTEGLAKRAIKWFIMGYGMVISSDYSLERYGSSKGKLEFREKFMDHGANQAIDSA